MLQLTRFHKRMSAQCPLNDQVLDIRGTCTDINISIWINNVSSNVEPVIMIDADMSQIMNT